ncbi:aldehyde dehydrogenase family protein [Rhizorhabdus dicambivorans]|uniref:Betaine-aldehyde dehydrogenase n=1 Tax=Rhizorhabdus dicambivorans TaxID=1850238 RepID=A0A2A4FV75_9SPHN|nr:aldehyde dehydrogenase family protein [Rhizorhabdus dicambivorans]ATE66156.1 betaine-aldehyde dehydrogenase [Rhizorhabdus dicambivorans]PCE42082.1 betaine-aldehyde dehydrogenase [Rhizorhabdus dicambivorans]
MKVQHSHFIGGEAIVGRSGDSIDVFDPSTGDRITQINAASAADVDVAVAAARHAFDSGEWQGRSIHERSATLWQLGDRILEHRDELAELEVRDNGRTLASAKMSITSAVECIRYHAGIVNKLHGIAADLSAPGRELQAYTRAEPVGVVGAITPWNAPFGTLIGKLAPALAAGCSVICKPAEQTPLTAIRLGELLRQWKLFPDGQVNIVNGLGSVAGAALAAHPQVDKLSFTGSTVTGRKLVEASAGNFKRLTLELGGKSPVFIFDDADLDQAIPAAAMAIFANAGQICVAGSRLYVQRGIFDKVVEGVAKVGAAMRLGSGMAPDTQMGPLVSQQQMEKVLSYIDSGLSEGARLVGDGGRRHGERGYFVRPTVFANRDRADLRIAREEIFGPVVTAMPFDGIEELAELANDTDYGLGAGVFTRSNSTAHRAAKLIRSGNVWINCYAILDKAMPFGGFKQSGWGRESGFEGMTPFLETKSVYMML